MKQVLTRASEAVAELRMIGHVVAMREQHHAHVAEVLREGSSEATAARMSCFFADPMEAVGHERSARCAARNSFPDSG